MTRVLIDQDITPTDQLLDHLDDDWETTVELDASQRERDMLAEGGKLAWTKQRAGEGGDDSAAAD